MSAQESHHNETDDSAHPMLQEYDQEAGADAETRNPTDPPHDAKTDRHAKGIYLHAFARSPYSLARTAFLATYLTNIAKDFRDSSGNVQWGFLSLSPTSYVGTYVSVATLLTTFSAPLIGAFSDYSPHRKAITYWAAMIGAVATMFMGVLYYPNLWWLGGILFVISFQMFEVTTNLVFAYLPQITPKDTERTKIISISIVVGNITQLVVILLMTGIMFAFQNKSLNLEGGGFESAGDVMKWSFNEDSPFQCSGQCGDSSFCESDTAICDLSSDIHHTHGSSLAVHVSPDQVPLIIHTSYPFTDPFDSVSNSTTDGGNIEDEVEDGQTKMDAPNSDIIQHRTIRFSGWVSGHIDDTQVVDNSQDDVEIFIQVQEDRGSKSIQVKSTKFKFLQSSESIKDANGPLQLGLQFNTPGTYYVDDLEISSDSVRLEPIFVCITGLWWMIFSWFAFRRIDEVPPGQTLPANTGYLKAAFVRLYKTFRNAGDQPNVFRFLSSLMFLSNGVIGIVAVVGPFFQEVMKMTSAEVAIALLSAQLAGIVGAVLAAKLGARFGLHKSCLMVLVSWNILVPMIYFVLVDESSKPFAFIGAAIFGMMLGAGLSLFRAFFTSMIPKGQEAEYMCLYDFFVQVTSWSGTLLFAIINQSTGSVRLAIMSMDTYFVLSLLIYFFVKPVKRNIGLDVEEIAGHEHVALDDLDALPGRVELHALTEHLESNKDSPR